MAIEMTRYIYLNKLIDSQKNGLIKVITGIARCGKSYLLFNSYYDYLLKKGVGESHIIELPLKDRGYKRLKNAEILLSYINGKIEDEDTYYILIDELQLIGDSKVVLNALLNFDNVDIYITGSDNSFLYTDVLGQFDVDCEEIKVSPLCYRELVEAYNGDKQLAMDNFVTYGGMPMVSWMNSSEEKKAYLYKVLSTKFMPELVEKYKIKNVDEFVELVRMMAMEIGCLTNPLQISEAFEQINSLRLTDKTVKKFLMYLCDELLLHRVLRYDIKRRKCINTPSKYYFEDVGMANTFLDFEELKEYNLTQNIIFNELKLRGYEVHIGVVELNVRNTEGKNSKLQLEVDFIATKGDNRYYIQVALNDDYEDKHKTLMYIKDSFKKIIIDGNDNQFRRDGYGIVTMGIKEFLFNDNSMEL